MRVDEVYDGKHRLGYNFHNLWKRMRPLHMEKSLWTGQSGVARVFLLIVLGLVLYFVWRILKPFFPALAWAAILATVFYPVYQRMNRYLRRRELTSVICCILLTVAIILPVVTLLFMMAGESVKAYKTLENVISTGLPAKIAAIHNSAAYKTLVERLREMGMPEPNIGAAAMRAVRAGSRFLVEHSATVVSSFMNFILQMFVMLFALYYLFLHGPQILRELRSLIPLRPEYEERIMQKFTGVVHATFTGSLAVALVQGALGGLGFLIFGIGAPLLWGASMALTSLVPVVGTALIWGPVAIFYLLTGSVLKGLLMLAVFGVAVGSVDNILKPVLIQRGMEIHTLWVFISVIGGLGIFGFLGVVLGPFLFTILVVLLEIYKV
ncbi:MAG: AI-2E family transporter, partial [Acidobacteria bacterium]|nr:AI-2E family transporter [Acidobacteriota bacterium]